VSRRGPATPRSSILMPENAPTHSPPRAPSATLVSSARRARDAPPAHASARPSPATIRTPARPTAASKARVAHTPVQCGADDPCNVYSCDPVLGCSSGTPVAEGTVCQLWWEPCVNDATCIGGVCNSPTANAEVPGQMRWIPLRSGNRSGRSPSMTGGRAHSPTCTTPTGGMSRWRRFSRSTPAGRCSGSIRPDRMSSS
jgi:hypothetical protein